MLIDDYTFVFGDGGITLNTEPVDSDQSFIDIVKVTGLNNAEYRITERDREGMDGGFIDSNYEKMRTIILEGYVYNASERFLDQLKANYAPAASAQPFYFLAPNITERLIFAKSYGLRYDWGLERRLNIVPIQIQLKAEDPSIYGPLITSSTTLRTAEAGTDFDLAFDFGFTNAVSGSTGTATVNNVGNKDSDCTFDIVGPITDPTILHDQTGYRLNFSIDLNATDVLTINLRNKSIMLNGTANRRGSLLGTSRWFLVKPGVNTFRFLGTAGAGTPQLNCSSRSAYR